MPRTYAVDVGDARMDLISELFRKPIDDFLGYIVIGVMHDDNQPFIVQASTHDVPTIITTIQAVGNSLEMVHAIHGIEIADAEIPGETQEDDNSDG